jgi:UDP-N-acetylglucosamine 4,6-dehydratase/5-epimerase
VLNPTTINEAVKDSTVLITGGTGSFGGAILSRLLETKVREVRVFSRDEQKHVALRRRIDDQRVRFMVGDVRDPARLAHCVRDVQIVFHAAALKHVHFTEMHPFEAVRTNVEGAQNVVRASQEAGVRTLVAISSDKAVQPVNVMGMTKALQERLVSSGSESGGLRTACVRYGNVLASNGSVLPFFQELLQQGRRVLPVTDERMTRFMLTLREGVNLALFAAQVASDGEIIIADLPAFRVMDLAEVMLDAYGGGEVQIAGIRPGEKLHEALISNEEMRRTERRDGYFIIRRHVRDDCQYRAVDGDYTSANTRMMDRDELRKLLCQEGFLSHS